MIVLKRDCVTKVDFDKEKIEVAILNAMKYGSGIIKPEIAKEVADEIEYVFQNAHVAEAGTHSIAIRTIERMVVNKLTEKGEVETAMSYEGYRAIQNFKRNSNTTDEGILGLIDRSNIEVMNENSNKNALIASTQRDLIAGEVSKDISRRKKLPARIVQAHDEGILHFHDMDYFMQSIFNCFSRDTKFITSKGVQSFEDFEDGDEVMVPTHTGEWKRATVKCYGKQMLQEVRLCRGGWTKRTIKVTPNHRWILKDGSITTDLKVGDKLLKTPDISEFCWDDLTQEQKGIWCLGFAYGDGQADKYYDLLVRLCGKKVQYVENFLEAGFDVSFPESWEGDASVKMTGCYKEVPEMTIDEIKIFVHGLLCADGHHASVAGGNSINEFRSIQVTGKEQVEVVYNLLNAAGYYVSSIHDKTNETTNYGTRNDVTIWFRFQNNQTYRRWRVTEITPLHEEEVWCLEVEDNHSFILEAGIVTGNCCLINVKDMLDNGTVINGCKIDSPHTFQVACTVMTQIIAQVASSQYGGQSVDIKALGKYLRRSREVYIDQLKGIVPDENLDEAVNTLLQKELHSGVQTIQYQINTLMTTNGQSPFVTLFLNIDEEDEYCEEVATIVMEIFKQRIKGIKNEVGVYVTPTFPKLVYVLHDHNSFKGGRFDYVTEVAVDCNIKRIYPDYISAKEMRKIYEGNVFSPMGCRSFLSPWKDANGNYKFEGRFNQGVVSINLPQIGIISGQDEEKCLEILNNRLELCFDALMCRHKALLGTTSDVSPIHWQNGAIARLGKGEVIDPLLKDGYSTLSLGYIGIYELTKLVKGVSHTTPEGREFALKIIRLLEAKTKEWKARTGLGFGLYGTPAESLCYRFAKIDKQKYGEIKDVTDKGYYTNSYHVDVREEIDAFSKLTFESEFQKHSTGGCISYIEIPNMAHNKDALKQMVTYIYENIQYAEFNTKSDYCQKCGFDGEIIVNEELEWECPCCGNKDQKTMNVVRRTCGYLGGNYWNKGKTQEIKSRVLHL